jgi:arsenate reductase
MIKFYHNPRCGTCRESLFQELYNGKILSNDECVDILLEHPILMERLIVVKDNKAIIGRPSIKVLDLLNCKI